MKQTLISIAIFFFSVTVFAQSKDTTKPEKVYTVKLTETEVQALWSVLQFSKSALPTSDASAKNVTSVLQGISVLEPIILKQYQAQTPQPKEQPKK